GRLRGQGSPPNLPRSRPPMPSGRRGRTAAAELSPESLLLPPQRATGAVAPEGVALPAAMAAQVERGLRAALDAVRFPRTRLVRSVAERLTAPPSAVPFATLEAEVHETVL